MSKPLSEVNASSSAIDRSGIRVLIRCVASYSKSGGVFLLLIGSLLALSGGAFCVLMWGSFRTAMEMRNWQHVDAEIIAVEIMERKLGDAVPREYAARVSYGYQIDSKVFTSEQVDYRGRKWSKEKTKAEETAANFSVGETYSAWVDPERLDYSVLKLPTKAAIYSIWFPALFFVGGMGIVARAGRKLLFPSPRQS